MTKDEALRLALEALEYAGPSWIEARQPAITAIKEALAQPEQDGKCKHCTDGCLACDARKLPEQDWVERERAVGYREGHRAALAQRTWVGLTDEEVKKIVGLDRYTDLLKEVVQYVEAKLRSKNNG